MCNLCQSEDRRIKHEGKTAYSISINSTVKPIFSYFNTHYLNIGIKTEN